jgi:hypothetical protein
MTIPSVASFYYDNTKCGYFEIIKIMLLHKLLIKYPYYHQINDVISPTFRFAHIFSPELLRR